jgi:hypothetical protein
MGGSRSTDEVLALKLRLSESGECDRKLMRKLCLYLVEPHDDPEVVQAAAKALEELARIDEICDPEALEFLKRCLEAQSKKRLRNDAVMDQVQAAIDAIELKLGEN